MPIVIPFLKKTIFRIAEIVVEISKLTAQERKALKLMLDEPLLESLPERTRSVLDFEGIGKKLQDIDAQENS
jgi:hypothetical protein